MTRARAPGVRGLKPLEPARLLSVLIVIAPVVLVAFTLAVGYVLMKQQAGILRVNEAVIHHHDSVRLADLLRHSSDDLTKMVRSYVATGDRTFKQYLYTILDIRDGTAPRPPGYERIFWDFVAAGDVPPAGEQGEKTSIQALMEQVGFSQEELHLLSEAKRRSDELVELEEAAIHAFEGRFRDDSGAFTVFKDPDREMALQLLFGKEYHQAKSAIMRPIEAVLRRVDERTSNVLVDAQEEQASLGSALSFLLGAFLVVLPLFLFTGYYYQRVSSAELIRSEERFRSTFEQAAVGIAHVSTTGRFLRINNRFCTIVGYTREEMLARTFQDITHPDDLDADVEHTHQLLRGESRTYSMEKRYFRKDGETVWVNITVSLLRDETGDPRWFVAVVEDISGRKAAEAKLQAYQKRLRALAADLTITEERERRRISVELHDGAVQTLASARMRLDTARKRSGTGEQLEELSKVSECLRHATLDANQVASNLSSPSLNELGLAAAISEWMQEQVGERCGIEMELVNHLEEADREGLDFVVRAILFRSVRELLANVVQHAGATKVSVILGRAGDRLELVVRDDGQGCDSAEALSSADDEGGFGLFSIRERMADLGGALRLDSEPGQGCTATLVMPLTARTPAGERPNSV